MPRCEAKTSAGNQCRRNAVEGGELCKVHSKPAGDKKPTPPEITEGLSIIKARTLSGGQVDGEHAIQDCINAKRQEIIGRMRSNDGLGLVMALIRANRTAVAFAEVGADAEEFDMRAVPEVQIEEALEILGGVGL